MKCKICGKEFAQKNTKHTYCSKECYEKTRNNYREDKTCLYCRKNFITTKPVKKFCSTKCRLDYRARGMTTDFGDLREYIIERDNFVCSQCGLKGRMMDLHCHHIVPLYRGGDHSEDNLQTLCHECHKKAHNIW